MDIVLGASGQVGSMVVDALLKRGRSIRAVIRDPKKAAVLESKGVNVAIADILDPESIKQAFKGGNNVFLLTPENPRSKHVLADTRSILQNYRDAISSSGISRVIGLSSMGAASKAGNLEMSYLLEHSFNDLGVERVFVRPAYYYSNWLGYFPSVKEQGVLPTFFPVDLKIPMAAPLDVADFLAKIIADETIKDRTFELIGPELYSAVDVAKAMGNIIGQKVEAMQLPREDWPAMMKEVGFSDDATDNLIKMTEAVISGTAGPEKVDSVLIKLSTALEGYLRKVVG